MRQWVPKRVRRTWARLVGDRGATTLEFVLLLAAIVLPSFVIVRTGLMVVAEHYRLVTTLNGMPMP